MKIARRRRLLVLVIVASFWLIFWIVVKKVKRPTSKASTELTQDQSKSSAVGPNQAKFPSPSSPFIPTARKAEQAFNAAFQTPIAFYGRVIDQHNSPVPDASVKFSANDKAFGGRPSEYKRKTDSEGRFSIDGIVGISLAVEVSKPGYRGIPRSDSQLSSSGLFEYKVSNASVTGPYQPDEEKPTIFVLYKPGAAENLVKTGEKSLRIARDGSPLSIALDEQITHRVVLRCWTNDLDRPEGRQKYDWRFEITVPDGGLVLRKDSFAAEAPEGGYTPIDTINMPASLPFGHDGWSGLAERSYFLRFDDGTFARANLRMHAGGDHFVVWESFLNPEPGHRNLEFDPAKQIKVK